jgi:hypothetical protein
VVRTTTTAAVRKWKFLRFVVDLPAMVRREGWEAASTVLELNNIEEVTVQAGIKNFRLAWLKNVKRVTLLSSQVGYAGDHWGITGNEESLGHLFSLVNVQKLVLWGVTGLARGGLMSVANLIHLKEILIEKCKGDWDASYMAKIEKVGIIGCTGVRDVGSLGGVKDLTLVDNSQQLQGLGQLGGNGQESLFISGCRNLTEVGHLSALLSLTLDNAAIEDVSKLGNISNLTIQRCHNLVDVSALANVQNLKLLQCRNLTDVSALYGLQTLDLFACRSIVDVSALGLLHTLNLSFCTNIRDVSALGGIHTLILSGCHGISDVSDLGRITRLDLSNCRNIHDVSALKSVKLLNLQGCDVVWDNEKEKEDEGGEDKHGGNWKN